MSSTANGAEAPPAWQLFAHQPSAPLRDLVNGYVGYTERTEAARVRREVPGTRVPIIIPLGPELEVATSRDGGECLRPFEGGFVAGLDDSYAVTRSQGTAGGIQVDFSPVVARAVCGLPMSELRGRIIDLEAVFGAEGRDLAEAVREAATWDERFALTDAFLLRRLARADTPSMGVLWAWTELRRSGGGAPASGLARRLGWTHKRLIREFREQIGLTPKTASRVIRFDNLNRKLMAAPQVCWADLATECGYFDQSHLVRDVVQFTGRTPGEHLRALRSDTAFQN